MKIAFVSTMLSDPWGGSEELWKGAALVLKQQGHTVFINVKDWGAKPKQIIELESVGCIVEQRKFYVHPSFIKRVTDKLLPKEKRHDPEYNKIGYLNRINADMVVICQGSNQDGIDWMEVCNALNIKYAAISQAAIEALWPVDGLAIRMRTAFLNAERTFFISQKNLELTEKQIGQGITNGKVVRNPFNVPYDASLGWPSEDVWNLACVGRMLAGAKGQDILFEVLAQDKWKSRNVKVTLFGSGPNAETFKSLIQYYGISDFVNLGGYVSSVSQVWEGYHALVLPSRYEGLPLAVVEAMLCGRVCIVTDVAGNKEVIEDNVSGFIAAAPTMELYDEAMERAWNRRSEWESIGKLAQIAIKQYVPANPDEVFAKDLIGML